MRPLAWGGVLTAQVALLRLVYPIAILLVEQAWAGLAVLLAALSIALSAVRGLTADRVTREVRAKLFDALTLAIERYPALPPRGAPPIEQLESEIAKGAPWVEALVAVTLPSIVGNAAVLPVIAWLSWARVGTQATLIGSGAMLCGVALGAVVARWVGKLGTIAWERYQPVARLIESGFRGRIELGVHSRAATHRSHLSAAVADWSLAERRLFVWGGITGWLVPGATLLCAVGLVSIAGFAPLALLHQLIEQPNRSVVAASLLALTALPALSALSRGIADGLRELPHLSALAQFVASAREEGTAVVDNGALGELGAIRAERVRFAYPGRRLGEPGSVVEASIVWEPGETLAISGPNGSGKTTLTWLMMGIIEPIDGTVCIEAAGATHSTAALTGRMAYLPQQPYFEEMQTVYEAIRFVAPNSTDQDIAQLVSRLLEGHYPGESARSLLERSVMSISTGERRAIAIARVLLRKSELVILDEPEANLDEQLRRRVMAALRESKRHGRMLIVTHDAEFASIADRIHRMP